MKLAAPIIGLRPWAPSEFAATKAATRQLRHIGDKAGAGSDVFQKACHELYSFVLNSPQYGVQQVIRSGLYVRAYAYLLHKYPDFRREAFPTTSILKAVEAVRWPCGRLTMGYLAQVFFGSCDEVDSDKLQPLADLLMRATGELSPSVSGEFGKWRKNARLLFRLDGPKAVVEKAIAEEIDLNELLVKLGLSAYRQSAFVQSCYHHYYISFLETLPVGQDHSVLKELVKADVHNSNYGDGLLIGHKALEILIDRTANSDVSDAWQRVVLSIAGDPRVGRHSATYTKWWQILGHSRARKVVGWLSRLDLRIFLEVLESSARSAGDGDIQRMYPPRKKFMEGLLEQGLVVQSRLFLSREAAYYLKRNYEAEDIPEHALVASGKTSVIYLELVGGLHMIEGTHSFKLKIFDQLPRQPEILDFGKKHYQDSELRTSIMNRYDSEARQSARPIQQGVHFIDQVHTGPVSWQYAAIKLLKENGVSFEASKFFDKDLYRVFKRNSDPRYWT